MALVTIVNPGHPAVAAALELWNERKAALAEHTAGCGVCTRMPPMRYLTCPPGRSLANAVTAAHAAVINADAAVSGPSGAQ